MYGFLKEVLFMIVVIASYLHRKQGGMGEDSLYNYFGGEGVTSSNKKKDLVPGCQA